MQGMNIHSKNQRRKRQGTLTHAAPHSSMKRSRLAKTILAVATAAAFANVQAAPRTPIGSVFVIAMENHNFTQPNPASSPQQILGNPAAPFINSLVTQGNPNAAQVSYATAYYNAGAHVHPSEPNYVWAEAGTDFGVHTDADPRSANNNTFYDESLHLTAQLNAAGVSWNNYQEDVELSSSPTNSAAGTNAPAPNPYYGTTQYNYAVKHNPMAFFTDTAVQNVYPLAQFFTDLKNGQAANYNWVTPNQFNDAHSALTGGFTYQGTHYTGDQASIAQGDNFLSMVIPQIMASPAYQNNGVIIIWWDETESGDDTNHTIPEIVISRLSKGNAYASTVPLNHSSDVKTVEGIFGLPFVNNAIPATETNVSGSYNNVALVNDLSDLFQPGVIPSARNVVIARGPLVHCDSGEALQVIHLSNIGSDSIPGPVFLVLDQLNPGVSLLNADGTTSVLAPLGSPYITVLVSGDGLLRPHETKTVVLRFQTQAGTPIDYHTRVLTVAPAP
jgi:phosphatidylinositol-3-phosphatase